MLTRSVQFVAQEKFPSELACTHLGGGFPFGGHSGAVVCTEGSLSTRSPVSHTLAVQTSPECIVDFESKITRVFLIIFCVT